MTKSVNNVQLDRLLMPYKPNAYVQLWTKYSLLHRSLAQPAQPTHYPMLIKVDVPAVSGMSQKVEYVLPTAKILKSLMLLVELATVELPLWGIALENVFQDAQAPNNGTAMHVSVLQAKQNTQHAKHAHQILCQTTKEQPAYVWIRMLSSTSINLHVFPALWTQSHPTI